MIFFLKIIKIYNLLQTGKGWYVNIDKMKDIEKKQGFLESILSKNDSKKIPFFHLGPENNWRKILDNSTKYKLTNIFKKNLKELSYN